MGIRLLFREQLDSIISYFFRFNILRHISFKIVFTHFNNHRFPVFFFNCPNKPYQAGRGQPYGNQPFRPQQYQPGTIEMISVMPANRNASGFLQNTNKTINNPNRNFQNPYQRIYVIDGKKNQENAPEENYRKNYCDGPCHELV